jgi:biopolymer transport protein ExbB
MIDLILKGGPLMYVILGGSLCMLSIIIERAAVFARGGFPRDKFNSIVSLLASSGREQTLLQLETDATVIGGFLKETLNRLDEPQDVLENELSIIGDRILEKLGKNLHVLSLIGRISPMVGLTGTVLGMVKAFYKVASLKSMVDASTLADGIWSALLTTVAGLFVAIPALIAHSLFENRRKDIAFKMKHYSEELIAINKRNSNDRF